MNDRTERSSHNRYGVIQLIPDDMPEDVARLLGETAWRARVDREGLRPIGEPSVYIDEPPSYIDESGALIVLPLEGPDGNPVLDEDGNEVPLPRQVRVVGEVAHS